MCMKRIVFDVSNDMYRKMDDAAVREGFATRAGFLRFLIVTYFKQNEVSSQSENSEETEDDNIFGKYEFGIPPDELEKIKEKAQKLSESERQRLS
jgi:hypothetical protein